MHFCHYKKEYKVMLKQLLAVNQFTSVILETVNEQ